MTTRHSRQLQAEAEQHIPGGVDSPVRAFRAVGGEPRWIQSGQGAWLVDADGNRCIDYIGSWGAMLLGHAHPRVVEALQQAARRGLSFGASTPAELQLAKTIQSFWPQMERLRFVNSGTEATMSAIRLARGFTGRDWIIKFEGCYHGHADALLVKAGSGVATFGLPSSAGVPAGATANTLALPFNDLDAVRAAFSQLPGQIAAVIVEPVVGNMGCVPPRSGYLQGLRELTRAEGTLLIFDEVMTGFRIAAGGASQRFGITADLVTLGKIVGGGMPVGVYGGRADIMGCVAPLGAVYQAGTLSGNPLSMAAGQATLDYIQEHPDLYATLEQVSGQLADGFSRAAAAAGVPVVIQRVGSMLTIFFRSAPVTCFTEAADCSTAAFARFHQAMLAQGVLLPPSQFEAAFLSIAHGPAEIEATLAAARVAFGQVGG